MSKKKSLLKLITKLLIAIGIATTGIASLIDALVKALK